MQPLFRSVNHTNIRNQNKHGVKKASSGRNARSVYINAGGITRETSTDSSIRLCDSKRFFSILDRMA